jgi:hypothetical protein
MKKTLTAVTMGLVLAATSANANARTYAYENLMGFFGVGQATLALEFANCPVYWASENQLFAIGAASNEPEMDAALDAVFQSSPNAVNCVIEMINRYDLLDWQLPSNVNG